MNDFTHNDEINERVSSFNYSDNKDGFEDSEELQEKWERFVRLGRYTYDTIQQVPFFYQTSEMWQMWVERSGYDYKNLKKVPERFQTKSLWLNFLEKNPNAIYRLPERFQTQDMWKNFLENYNYDIDAMGLVNESFQTREMWNEFLKRGGDIKNVPVKFQSEELWESYLEKVIIQSPFQKNFRLKNCGKLFLRFLISHF